ncbi:MAG TPA: hypothetical protein VKY33_02690 [Flavobacterium sp.]|nr:hypothetical protein [Flavobacterium sp.]
MGWSKIINPNRNIGSQGFTEYNDKLYFSAFDIKNGRELWATDRTTSGTLMLKDVNPNGNHC